MGRRRLYRPGVSMTWTEVAGRLSRGGKMDPSTSSGTGTAISSLFLQKGFGDVDGEHWLGLETIYNLGKQEDYKLLVELEDWMGKKVYAAYSSFHLEPESQSYRLRLGTYQGNAGDSLSSHNGKQFTTLDHDNDAFSGNCAHFHKAGWWYSACGQANLNGVWYSGGVYRSRFQDGIFWADYGGGFYSMKSVRMMIRPID